jgi:hypothetical protein
LATEWNSPPSLRKGNYKRERAQQSGRCRPQTSYSSIILSQQQLTSPKRTTKHKKIVAVNLSFVVIV